jgi:KDO2-lipid IV(A) lauroyltransferase
MQLLIFLLAYPLIWLISILPFPVLYVLSDCTYILIYRIIGYRKRTVRQNLALAFPHKSAAERLEIEKKSYKHLCDMFLEMAKTMTISKAEINRRYTIKNLDFYLQMEAKPKSIALLCAHYASYEWAISMNSHIRYTGYAIYKKLGNRYLDRLVRKIRSRFNAELITTKEVGPTIEQNEKNGVHAVYGFASDQSPKASKAFHWTNFMGIHTPVHTGGEMFAKRYDMTVLFLKATKVKRGYYEAQFQLISENPKEVPDYQITDEFLRRVELQIAEAPEYYLWTHKRWKHSIAEKTIA